MCTRRTLQSAYARKKFAPLAIPVKILIDCANAQADLNLRREHMSEGRNEAAFFNKSDPWEYEKLYAPRELQTTIDFPYIFYTFLQVFYSP